MDTGKNYATIRLPAVIVVAILCLVVAVLGCHEKENEPLKGWQPLLARGDGSADSFIQLSVEASEQFRDRFSTVEPDRPAKIESLARLMRDFVAESETLLEANLGGFEVQPEVIVDAFRGEWGKAIDAQAVFGPFTGEWYGRWDDFDVDHQWGEIVSDSPPRVVEFDLGSERCSVRVLGWQYAWVGDGYGLNLVIEEDADGDDDAAKRQVVLGYVEHLRDGNLDDITARRPHVGIDAGHGKIIWITAGEVFFEQAHFEAGIATGYSIVGFDYAMTDNEVRCRRAFSTYYARDASKPRKPFRSTPCELHVQREVRVEAAASE